MCLCKFWLAFVMSLGQLADSLGCLPRARARIADEQSGPRPRQMMRGCLRRRLGAADPLKVGMARASMRLGGHCVTRRRRRVRRLSSQRYRHR